MYCCGLLCDDGVLMCGWLIVVLVVVLLVGVIVFIVGLMMFSVFDGVMGGGCGISWIVIGLGFGV